jgi:hypothetical protein
MNAKTSRAWRVLNSLILITAFVAPWEIVYSDAGGKSFKVIGLMTLVDSIPSDLAYIFSFDCLSCVSTGLVAIGYLSLTIYTVLNFLRILRAKTPHQNLQKVLGFCVVTSSLFFLRIDFPMIMIVLAWGYWLACSGLLSSLCLEIAELLSGKVLVYEVWL